MKKKRSKDCLPKPKNERQKSVGKRLIEGLKEIIADQKMVKEGKKSKLRRFRF